VQRVPLTFFADVIFFSNLSSQLRFSFSRCKHVSLRPHGFVVDRLRRGMGGLFVSQGCCHGLETVWWAIVSLSSFAFYHMRCFSAQKGIAFGFPAIFRKPLRGFRGSRFALPWPAHVRKLRCVLQ